MSTRLITYTMIAAMAAASVALPSVAQAKYHHGHHKHLAKAKLVPAHVKPGYPAEAQAALLFPLDVGMGPVFPFDGFVLK